MEALIVVLLLVIVAIVAGAAAYGLLLRGNQEKPRIWSRKNSRMHLPALRTT